MAKGKKKPVAMKSKKSGKKRGIIIKQNNEILKKLKNQL
jgi:hypothetical protein